MFPAVHVTHHSHQLLNADGKRALKDIEMLYMELSLDSNVQVEVESGTLVDEDGDKWWIVKKWASAMVVSDAQSRENIICLLYPSLFFVIHSVGMQFSTASPMKFELNLQLMRPP